MSAAREARESAGLSVEQVARRARLSVGHLRHIERAGCDAYYTARRLAAIYGVPVDVFLKSGGGSTPPRQAGRRRANRLPATYVIGSPPIDD